MKKTKTSLARKIFIVFDYLVLIFLAVVCLLPILHVAFASVSDPNWVMNQSGLILKPHGFTLEGYKLVFQTRQSSLISSADWKNSSPYKLPFGWRICGAIGPK